MTASEDREVGQTGDPVHPGVDADGRTVYVDDDHKAAGDPSNIKGTAAQSEFAAAEKAQLQPTRDSEAAFLTNRSDPNVNPHTDDPRVKARPAVQRQAEIDADEVSTATVSDSKEDKPAAKKTAARKSTTSKAASGTKTLEEGSQD